MSETNYRVPDILDMIYGDIIKGVYFNSLHPKGYNRIKLAKCNIACDLLLKSSYTEEDIVYHVGFPGIREFREEFKHYLGINPLEFRNRFAEKK